MEEDEKCNSFDHQSLGNNDPLGIFRHIPNLVPHQREEDILKAYGDLAFLPSFLAPQTLNLVHCRGEGGLLGIRPPLG